MGRRRGGLLVPAACGRTRASIGFPTRPTASRASAGRSASHDINGDGLPDLVVGRHEGRATCCCTGGAGRRTALASGPAAAAAAEIMLGREWSLVGRVPLHKTMLSMGSMAKKP